MPWRPRLQGLSFLPWPLLVDPSVISTSGPLNEPVRAPRPAQYLECRLKATTCNSVNLGPSTPPGALYLNVSTKRMYNQRFGHDFIFSLKKSKRSIPYK